MSQARPDIPSPGFADSAREQQRAFRVVMEALSRPGRIIPFRSGDQPPPGLTANAMAIAQALLDVEVIYHLSASLSTAADDVTFRTGSLRTFHEGEANFALLDLTTDPLELSVFAQGVPDYPDRSATLIVCCDNLENGPELALSGPGIAGVEAMRVEGLPDDFPVQWRANAARSPLGVDLIFVSDNGVLGLPRSSRLVGGMR